MTADRSHDDGGLVSPGNDLADDTHVGSAPVVPDVHAEPSPAHPDALVDGGDVGDGTELE
jgi:hypothetical protein